MNAPLTVIVLPGLDGTGLMLGDFAVALKPHFRVEVLHYPTDKPFGYDQLLEDVRAHLPEDDHILVGESFSGPLALRLALEAPAGLKGVVLGASFALLDLPLKAVLSQLAGFVSPHIVPTSVLAHFPLGCWATPERRGQLRQALAGVAPDVLAARARTALAVDLLREGGAVRMQIRDIAAPHFLFQVAPDECAAAIRDFVGTIEGG